MWTWWRRRRIRASNYGRDFGWAVLRDEVVVGKLIDPVWEGQFWHSYRLVAPACPRPESPRFDILAPTFWEHLDGLKYVNLALGLGAPKAFPALRPLRGGRVWMRALYL